MSEVIRKKEQGLELKFAKFAPEVWEALGKLLRSGWVKRGVKNPETVQEHTIAMMDLAFNLETLSDNEKEELIEMCEIHDWPEVINGDQIVAVQDENEKKILEANKFEAESRAMAIICRKMGPVGKRVMELWQRFENSEDKVASIARQLDKYQAIDKSLEYERAQGIPMFKAFYDYSKNNINHPVLVDKLKELVTEYDIIAR